MERRGPDSLEGLFIAIIVCLISTLMYGAQGLSSMLFVACIERFNTDRNRASFPFILSTVLQAVSGPFAGYFARRFNVRIVVLVGSIFAFLGIGTCFFAEDILTVTVLWGIVFGIGFGLSTLLLPVIINEYFFKQRSAALGMSYLGSPIGFFVFPPIFEVLVRKYGLSGTFLVLAGINMHCIPLSLFLKQPNFKSKPEKYLPVAREKQDLYSSKTSAEPNRMWTNESEKHMEVNGMKVPRGRRHSVEFLWKHPASKKQFIDDGKNYMLSLNKNSSGEEHYNKDILRSFKKTSKNCYETSEKSAQDFYRHTSYKNTSAGILSSILGENNKYSPSTGIDNPAYYHECDQYALSNGDTNIEKNELGNPKIQGYDEISTIYFGTYQNLCISEHCDSQVQSQSNYCYFHDSENRTIDSSDQKESENKFSELTYPSKSLKTSEIPKCEDVCETQISKTIDVESNKDTEKNSLLNLFLNPVFILMCIINAIVNLHFTTISTVVIDFARDHEVEIDYEKFIMMAMSLSGALGMLGFGWVTDGDYLTRTKFGAVCQLLSSVSTTVLPFTVGFETLVITLSVWCVCQSIFIPLIPAITAEQFNEDMQAVAVSACNVLSGPLYLIVPPLIGCFRDDGGSYDNIFFLLGILSFLNCIAVFTIPYLARRQSKL